LGCDPRILGKLPKGKLQGQGQGQEKGKRQRQEKGLRGTSARKKTLLK